MENNYNNVNINNCSVSEKKEYYENLKKQCLSLKCNQQQYGQELIKKFYPFLRKYKLDIQGEENIPKDSNVLFVANHSNSHDIFTAYEMFSLLKRQGSVLVATDCLSTITTQIFNISNATLLDRRIKDERKNSVLVLSNKLLNGKDGLIFGEGTWNLHPIKTMHNIQNGAAKISLITQNPIIPTIIEYIEKNKMVSTDNQLYDKCIIRFGKPIIINYSKSLSEQSSIIKDILSTMRKEIWHDNFVERSSLSSIDQQMYINHTYAKKFKAFGFTYDSKEEQNYLFFMNDEKKENEYTINFEGDFVPGITEKDQKLGKILK